MKKALLLFICLILNSCVTNYYAVTLEEDTPIYKNRKPYGDSVLIIPKGNVAYVAYGDVEYRKIKWNNYKAWVKNKNDAISTSSTSYSITPISSNNNSYSQSYKTRATKTSSGGTVHVKGYTRKDGTYVKPHTRSAPRRR